MTPTELLPITAGIFFLAFTVFTLLTDDKKRKGGWLFPAGLSLVFLAYSLHVVFVEGATGFWTEHIRNRWGNQIWLDLLLAIGIGWFLIVLPARKLGMRLPFWLLLIVCCGCIGLLATLARMLWLQERTKVPVSA